MIKRIFDITFSLIGIILLSPLFIPCLFLVWVQDFHSPFYIAPRVGKNGKVFKMVKIRSMIINADKTGVDSTSSDDMRITSVGKVIRKLKLDELSQLWNVLIGDMSLVGPRPHPVSLDLNYSNIYEAFLTRYRCNPGLTGWSQVNGLRGATPNPEIMKRRMEFDLWYLNNWTIWLDLYIILKTFYAVIKYEGD